MDAILSFVLFALGGGGCVMGHRASAVGDGGACQTDAYLRLATKTTGKVFERTPGIQNCGDLPVKSRPPARSSDR